MINAHRNSILNNVLSHYSSENPGVKNNLARILLHGKLAYSGKLVILPVDQGFEHGPAQSFGPNPAGYDPAYHIQLAVEAGLSAFAAPLGLLECVASQYAGLIPTILKINSSTLLNNAKTTEPRQTIYGSIEDALRLGCVGVGFTIYPGSDHYMDMLEDIAPMIAQAKKYGLVCVVWSYPRGSGIIKESETSLDIICYAAHMACLIGAHIVKVKLPEMRLSNDNLSKFYPMNKRAHAVGHVVHSCFDNKRIVIFSGGGSKDDSELLEEINAINQGKANGSIIGRNVFQRPKAVALRLLEQIITIYKNESINS